MKHKGCGGVIRESKVLFYRDEEYGEPHPALFCTKCNNQIVGNLEIELPDEDPETILPSIY